MRTRHAAWALYVLLTVSPVFAQTAAPATTELVAPPAWAYNDLACAPTLRIDKSDAKDKDENQLRVVGVQDGTFRDLMGPPDVLVVSGGSVAGLEAGQRYFLRRIVKPVPGSPQPPTIHTAGWVQILGVDTNVATAQILHACEGILLDDYLEPFVQPMIAAKPINGNAVPQYDNMGHIVTGVEGFQTAAIGSLMTIDRGSNASVVVGQRFLVFRDKRKEQLDTTGASKVLARLTREAPLVEIGQVLVVSVRPNDATVQVTVAKTAITMGDMIAPIQ